MVSEVRIRNNEFLEGERVLPWLPGCAGSTSMLTLPLFLSLGAVLQLHDESGVGTVEFESTGTATLVGNEHSINASVSLVVSSCGYAAVW